VIQLRGVLRQEVARLHARPIEGTLPAVRSKCSKQKPGFGVTRWRCGWVPLLGVWVSRREPSRREPNIGAEPQQIGCA
jgi:hypothetical protein